ncbi:MAG: hypothetical protein NZ811_00095 [Gammaproteobacteria bacterium]|nr:hypothetical protein [Gammaproteobacteria bacterium]
MNLDTMKEEVMELMESYFDQLIEDRMDIVGQNGNDGLHYEEKDSAEDLPLHYVNFGAGMRQVHQIIGVDEKLEKEYWAKLRELPDDDI